MISNCFMSKRKATNESEKKCPKKKKHLSLDSQKKKHQTELKIWKI